MPNILVVFGCLILGAAFGAWKRPEDAVAYALGIACGVTLAFATTDAWYLLALLLFVPLVIWRRKSPYNTQ
jgi:hypothetical protein